MLRKILQPIYILYAILVFIIGLIITFLIVLVISIVNTRPARVLTFGVLKRWAEFTLILTGMPLKIIGKQPKGKCIVVANHITYLDAATLMASKLDYFRPLGKIELAKVPLFGFLYKRITILVDRSSPESRSQSMKLMLHYLNEESNIFVFPEGTFNETDKPLKDFYDGAFRLAITAQLPVFPIVFPDVAERWPYKAWWTTWPGRNRAVLLDPVSTTGLTQDDLPMLKQKVYTIMENALVKYQAMP